jgi:hypothetical protein
LKCRLAVNILRFEFILEQIVQLFHLFFQEFVVGSASGKLMLPKAIPSPSKAFIADESSSSILSSNADSVKIPVAEHHGVDLELVELDADSNHSIGSQETSAVDLSEYDEQPPSLLAPDDVDMALSKSPKILSKSVKDNFPSPDLLVSTPPSRERHKVSTENYMPSLGELERKESISICDCVSGNCGGCSKLSTDSIFKAEEQKVRLIIDVFVVARTFFNAFQSVVDFRFDVFCIMCSNGKISL